MSRPTKSAYDLSDAEKCDLVALIQAGKPLPERFRSFCGDQKGFEAHRPATFQGLVAAFLEYQE